MEAEAALRAGEGAAGTLGEWNGGHTSTASVASDPATGDPGLALQGNSIMT